ncbi:hypothetical protein [Carboxylicivirga sp. M1479]|uniref:hypothetical protein n=1 Tax=Carboxylicivirga sp. M1479 TaxID=2594476 RepID=UPI0011778A1D|nr:hypothetical protein [Carboxylicivirga sp. M1479]TRX70523.1 hypothetical protein FNN09_11130 [Carboxylicivirga sp. M1479]
MKNFINKTFVFTAELFSGGTILTIFNDETIFEIISELKNIGVLIAVHLISNGFRWMYKRISKTK